jgi:hypothetical protein
MKKGIRIFTMLLILPVWISFQPVSAQEKPKEAKEKEKELTIQEEIDLQKKAIREQQKANEEMQKELEKNQAEIERSVRIMSPEVPEPPERSGGVRVFTYPRSSSSYTFDNHFIFSSPGRNFFSEEGGERSTLDFSKSVKESSFSSDFSFNVEKTAKTVVMAVTGDCRSGEIRIKIIMPNGKTYSDILVDESGNLNWRKSFNCDEIENKSKTGEWKYEINGSNATGYFKISLQTF